MSDNIIEMKVDQLALTHKTTATKLDELGDRLLDPDNGLFVKVRDVDVRTRLNEENIDELRSDIDKLVEVSRLQEKSIAGIEHWVKDHEYRDDELRKHIKSLAESMTPLKQDFEVRQQRKKWTDRIMWLIIATIITAMIPTVRYLIFDAPVEQKKIENLERMYLKDRVQRNSRQK